MIFVKIKDVDLIFETESSIFSPNSIDKGTLAMLSVIDFVPSDKVLELADIMFLLRKNEAGSQRRKRSRQRVYRESYSVNRNAPNRYHMNH